MRVAVKWSKGPYKPQKLMCKSEKCTKDRTNTVLRKSKLTIDSDHVLAVHRVHLIRHLIHQLMIIISR